MKNITQKLPNTYSKKKNAIIIKKTKLANVLYNPSKFSCLDKTICKTC